MSSRLLLKAGFWTAAFLLSLSLCSGESVPVTLRVDSSKPSGPWQPFWRFFGADEPNYATMKDGRKLLNQIGTLAPGHAYFRTHNLLTSGDGTPALKWGSTGVYSENELGEPIYNWSILDSIFDSYLTNRVRPYVQIGFMPKALSIKPDPYQHHWDPTAKYNDIFTGWAYPPKDYPRWGDLAFEWTRHCIAKYGRAEVEQWYWEAWNEPNIGYWRGSPGDFLKLHDFAVAGVRRALPTARVGGPDTAGSGGKFMRAFLDHCLRGTNFATGHPRTPLDFVSFHAKGAPKFVDGHVRMGIAEQLRTVDEGFRIVASYPELKSTPIVIGECDPDGCAACQGPQLGYRNGTLYSSYTAASFARIPELARKHNVRLEGVLTWAFEFEDQPWFAGFRVLASNGITLPVFNVFRMFSRLSGEQLSAETDFSASISNILTNGVRAQPDISALATRETNRLAILLWHYHDDDLPGPTASVTAEITRLDAASKHARLTHYIIDQDHCNSFSAWQRLGSPQHPSAQQYAELEDASLLKPLAAPKTLPVTRGQLTFNLSLPRQAVSLLILDLEP